MLPRAKAIQTPKTCADNSSFLLNSFWIWRYYKILTIHKGMRMLWNPISIPWDTHIHECIHVLDQNLCFTLSGWCRSFPWLRQGCWEREMVMQRGWVEVRRSRTSATLVSDSYRICLSPSRNAENEGWLYQTHTHTHTCCSYFKVSASFPLTAPPSEWDL